MIFNFGSSVDWFAWFVEMEWTTSTETDWLVCGLFLGSRVSIFTLICISTIPIIMSCKPINFLSLGVGLVWDFPFLWSPLLYLPKSKSLEWAMQPLCKFSYASFVRVLLPLELWVSSLSSINFWKTLWRMGLPSWR